MSDSMISLYCWACDTAHQFSKDEAEQLVYVLLAMAGDETLDQPREGNDPAYTFVHDTCLDMARSFADDVEGYYEHVQQGVESRRACTSTEERTSWRDSVIDEHLGTNRQR